MEKLQKEQQQMYLSAITGQNISNNTFNYQGEESDYSTPAMESEYSNFNIDTLLSGGKKSFADRVAEDIKTIDAASNQTTSTTQKVLIGVGILGVIGLGWFAVKKIKSGKKISVSV